MMKKLILVLLVLFTCLCVSALAEEDGAALYEQGAEALKSGDYATAAAFFEKAAAPTPVKAVPSVILLEPNQPETKSPIRLIMTEKNKHKKTIMPISPQVAFV